MSTKTPLPLKEPVLPPEMWPNIDHLVIEDGVPVDNILSEKQQRLLTEPLYSSWASLGNTRPFLACANVGLFYALHHPPLVPDVFLSLDVQAPRDLGPKNKRSYFFWEFGKAPEISLEIVSNLEGEETTRKLEMYAHLGIPYYVVWDPLKLLGTDWLRAYALREGIYERLQELWFPRIDLGLSIWQGHFEGIEGEWLRWCDRQGQLVPTGAELAERERQRADRLAAQLRALGVDPKG